MERVVFVCDNFADTFTGGAELSLQTHIDSCPFPKVLVRAKDFNPKRFNEKKDLLIFGNFATMDRGHFQYIQDHFRYVIEECDYKYCAYRSSHKHEYIAKTPCDCHKQAFGVETFAFMASAEWVFWKSERQRAEYARLFDFDKSALMWGSIMGGVFSDETLDYIEALREEFRYPDSGRSQDEYFVLYSESWIKGYTNAARYCRDNGLKMKVVGNLPYKECLRAMASCKGLVYMPNGFDVSCRMVTEAKCLRLKIFTNELVQHVSEPWFTGTDEERMRFLRSRNPEFWKTVSKIYKRK